MITSVRLAGAIVLLFAEAVFPDANMIVLIAFVWIGLALIVDTQSKARERAIACYARRVGKRLGAEQVIKATETLLDDETTSQDQSA